MEQRSDLQFEAWLRQTASGFTYPPSPDVGAMVQDSLRRKEPGSGGRLRPAWALLALLVAAALLMLVPQVRASVLEILRAGGITIFVTEPTPQAVAATPTSPPTSATMVTVETESHPPPILLPVRPTSLQEVREAFPQAIALPSSSPQIGALDHVYIDDEREPKVVVMDWLDDESDELLYRLYAIAATDFALKEAQVVEIATVDGSEAFWIAGNHAFLLEGESSGMWQLAGGPVLIWSEDELTYRLEGAASLEEARRFAESLE